MTRYGFIEYATEQAALDACKKLNMKNIWGNGKITVERAFVRKGRDETKSWQDYK